MKFDKFFISLYGFFISIIFISDYIFCLKLTQKPAEKPINLKVVPSRMNKLTLDDLDQIKMEVLHDMNSQLKDLEDEMAEKQNLKEKTSSSWSITGAPIYLPRDPNEPGKKIPTKNKIIPVKSPAQDNFSKDIKKMLSFKELEKQLLEADEVLNELKMLKADKEKRKKEFLNQKFKEKPQQNKNKNQIIHKNNNVKTDEKEKIQADKKILEKSTNSTTQEKNLKIEHKDSNSTHSIKNSDLKSNKNIETIDLKKKISESLEPFENEIKKLLNINTFTVNDLILKVNKTSNSVEVEKSEKSKNSENLEKPSDTKISESSLSNKNSEKTQENSETDSQNGSKNSQSLNDDMANKEIKNKKSNTESSDHSSSQYPILSTQENLKLAKDLNQELKEETKDFQNNFLKDEVIKQNIGEIRSNNLNISENDSTFIAVPNNELSSKRTKNKSKSNKKLSLNDLNNLKQETQGDINNQIGSNSNVSLIQKSAEKSSAINQSNNFAFNISGNIFEDGKLNLPDGPILDIPFFGMI